MTNEIDPASIDPDTPEGRAILVHICVYCHDLKNSVVEANACEVSHQNDPDLSSQDLHRRFVQYERKFLRRRPYASKNQEREK